ncbi:MAG TPA: hypothetical protein VIJ22_09785 [Polyangiaceae bacterium]
MTTADELVDIARTWLQKEGLLRTAFKPPDTEAECVYGYALGEWAEMTEDYERDVAYNDKLVTSLVEVLARL